MRADFIIGAGEPHSPAGGEEDLGRARAVGTGNLCLQTPTSLSPTNLSCDWGSLISHQMECRLHSVFFLFKLPPSSLRLLSATDPLLLQGDKKTREAKSLILSFAQT